MVMPGRNDGAALSAAAGRDDEDGARAAGNPHAPLDDGNVAELHGIRLTEARHVIDLASGITKLELARYYCDLAAQVLPQLAGRPFALLCAPDGVGGEQFFLRHPQTLSIPGLRRLKTAGGDVMEIRSEDALVGAVQMGAIEFHTWNADRRQWDRPDRMVLDLDPGPLLSWSDEIAAAHHVLEELDALELPGFIKTSGCRGLHIVVPLARHHSWMTVREFSRAFVQQLVRKHPRCFTEERGFDQRIGRIYIDYLRNQRGGTMVAAYSARARPGLPVSAPIARDELDRLSSAAQWTVASLPQRLQTLPRDPWEGYANTQSITQAMRDALGLKL